MTDLLVVLNEGKRHFVMGKKEKRKMMDGFGREVLLKRKFIFLPCGKLQRDSEPGIRFPGFLD